MKNGGLIPWNAVAICEMSKTLWQTGKLLMKGDSENHVKDQWFRLAPWLNTIRFLRKTSQGSTNLVRIVYLEYSSDTWWSRGEFGKEIFWSRTLRNWKILDAAEIHPRRIIAREVFDATKELTFLYSRHQKVQPNCLEEIMESENPLSTSRKLGEVSTVRNKRWRWRTKRFLVYPRWLHLSSSQRTSGPALRAERRNIPNSTELHWRNQDDAHKFGCVARKPYRWLLECRCGSRDVSDSWTGFTKFTLLNEKPPKGWHLVRERLTKIQATARPKWWWSSILWPEIWGQGPTCQRHLTKRRRRMGHWKAQAFISSIWKMEIPMKAAMPCKMETKKRSNKLRGTVSETKFGRIVLRNRWHCKRRLEKWEVLPDAVFKNARRPRFVNVSSNEWQR